MKWPLSSLSAATILCAAVGLVVGQAAQNARNVSFDDQDARITYSPSRSSWTLTEPGDWDAGDGRAHMLSDNAEAKASFKFTGIALHYWAARWPYSVLTTVAIDGLEFYVNLTDPNPSPGVGLPPSQKSSIVFSATDLDNTEHDVTISVGKGPEGNFAIVDYFTFTELENTTSTTASATTSTASSTQSTTTESDDASATTDSSQTGSSSKGLSTALKVSIAVAIIGVFGVLLVLFFLLRWLKKRKQEQRQSEKTAMLGGYLSPDPGRSTPSSSLMMKQAGSPAPTGPGHMWNDPDYMEAARRMNVPLSPYQQPVSSRSSVRLVVPEDDIRRFSDGSDYPTTGTISPPPDQPIHIPYHPYASSQPYTSSYGFSSQSYAQR